MSTLGPILRWDDRSRGAHWCSRGVLRVATPTLCRRPPSQVVAWTARGQYCCFLVGFCYWDFVHFGILCLASATDETCPAALAVSVVWSTGAGTVKGELCLNAIDRQVHPVSCASTRCLWNHSQDDSFGPSGWFASQLKFQTEKL